MPRFNPIALAVATLGLSASIAGAQQYTFVSIPDFLNMDLGDIRMLPGYDGGANSWTPGYEQTTGWVLDRVAAENPQFVAVAGDLVMGIWDEDIDNRQIFGPANTLPQKRAAIDAAGDFYYGAWNQRFSSRGLTVFPAVGDHEIGDDGPPTGEWRGNSGAVVPDYKAEFAQHFTQSLPGFYSAPGGQMPGDGITAYAVRQQNMLLITTDQFEYAPTGNFNDNQVALTLDATQQQWLEDTIAAANADPTIDHIVVQGHMPVAVGATLPARNSSNLRYPGGTGSDKWQAMSNGGVDLFLAGEIHDDSARKDPASDLVQVVTGSVMGESITGQYTVGYVNGDVIRLEIRDYNLVNIGGTQNGTSNALWQTASNRPHEDVAIENPDAMPRTIGGITIDKSSGSTVFRDAWGTFDNVGGAARPDAVSQADGNLLVNAGFEDTPLADATQTKDFNLIPGWQTTDTIVNPENDHRTGVRDGAGESSNNDEGFAGENRLFFFDGDGEVFQITNHAIAAGDAFELTFFSRSTSREDLIEAAIVYDDGMGNLIDIARSEGEILEDDWAMFTLSVDGSMLPGGAIGNFVGVAFDNLDTTGDEEFLQVDNVLLTVTPIPEPTSLAMLALGSAVVLTRRRRQRQG